MSKTQLADDLPADAAAQETAGASADRELSQETSNNKLDNDWKGNSVALHEFVLIETRWVSCTGRYRTTLTLSPSQQHIAQVPLNARLSTLPRFRPSHDLHFHDYRHFYGYLPMPPRFCIDIAAGIAPTPNDRRGEP